ncbi:ComGF family competence protein [Bacillus wiedmannii]|uniref:ComGF family competence protein n=1 Tax=Bacillus wiedmannii TaxID=1890302 RepID=UPI000BF61FCB|nr:ComGF family competence protein [Bacillus wiedmannii]PGA00424.1 competence protein ComG [Bacillus wiedmannii]
MLTRVKKKRKRGYLFIGQVQLEFREVSFVEKIVPENKDNLLRFRLRTGDEVTYEKLNNHLIRKVNMRGREVILQNVEMVSYEVTPHLLFINVKDMSGKIYEGVAVRYSEMEINT